MPNSLLGRCYKAINYILLEPLLSVTANTAFASLGASVLKFITQSDYSALAGARVGATGSLVLSGSMAIINASGTLYGKEMKVSNTILVELGLSFITSVVGNSILQEMPIVHSAEIGSMGFCVCLATIIVAFVGCGSCAVATASSCGLFSNVNAYWQSLCTIANIISPQEQESPTYDSLEAGLLLPKPKM